jgi:hypothetical protein
LPPQEMSGFAQHSKMRWRYVNLATDI